MRWRRATTGPLGRGFAGVGGNGAEDLSGIFKPGFDLFDYNIYIYATAISWKGR